jgi:hypothetical protein
MITSNPFADVLKLPHWFLEITNNKVFVKNTSESNVFIRFGLQNDFRLIRKQADEIEYDLNRLKRQGKPNSH